MRKVVILLPFLCILTFANTISSALAKTIGRPDTIAIKLKNKKTEILVRSLFVTCKPGTIPYILQQTFGKSLDFHLSINDFIYLPDSIMAIAIEGNTNLDKYVSSILINHGGLQSASEPYVVSVFMHEFLHIYLKFTRPNSLFNDHEEMANEHIPLLMNSMKEVYPVMPKFELEAYAWGGLQKTKAWHVLVHRNRNKAIGMFDFAESQRLGHKLTIKNNREIQQTVNPLASKIF